MKMREAIRSNKTFHDWLREQPHTFRKDSKEVAKAQLTFEEMQESLNPPLQKSRRDGQFIVIQIKPPQPLPQHTNPFVIHSTQWAAEHFGKLEHPFGQWRVVPYLVWKNTFYAKALIRKQKILASFAIRKPKLKLLPLKNNPHKGIDDKIALLQTDKVRLEIKGDTLGVARIQNNINNLQKRKKLK